MAAVGTPKSFHLRWDGPARLVEVRATVTVEQEPTVDDLYFWALQVSFLDQGRRHGGAHVGLQWNPQFPDRRAANWGGYAEGGGVLDGTESALTSAPGDRNTRDFPWEPHRPYVLRVRREEPGRWAGFVDDVHVRTLVCPGAHLGEPVVWSEVFASCDAPRTVVRWTDLEATDEAGRDHVAAEVTTAYQERRAGGCENTTSIAGERGVLQVTNIARAAPPGTTLPLA